MDEFEDWDTRYKAHVAPIQMLCVRCLPPALAAVVQHEEAERAKWISMLPKSGRPIGVVGKTGSTYCRKCGCPR